MAQYMFVLVRDPAGATLLKQRMARICGVLTPDLIRDGCNNVVDHWPGLAGGLYGIQNSEGVRPPSDGVLVIGWIDAPSVGGTASASTDSDGSYAVIRSASDTVSFFVDQFGSRTLWHYQDERMLVVSTSQRAVVGLKGSFLRNDEALAWFLSSGCQGPFISWDREIQQARPDREYVFDIASWTLTSRERAGMALPASGSIRLDSYLQAFERRVGATLSRMVQEAGPGRTLLPLSGGLDSRLLFGFCRHEGIGDQVTLVNWGVPSGDGMFDDKAAASRIARAYRTPLMDMMLPEIVDEHDGVLERFACESEGRIDHFNAYTDGFAMWAEFHQGGFRTVMRGDLPYTEGLDLDEPQSRAHIGLEPFSDFSNCGDFPVEAYASLQSRYDVSRHPDESLVRWRDRLYVEWRMPLVISAFADLISGYVENRAPMVNWSLFRQYMALPDTAKGSKPHIRSLWRKHDQSGVPSHASGSLKPLAAFFNGGAGSRYLQERLELCAERGVYPDELLAAVSRRLSEEAAGQWQASPSGIALRARSLLSDHLPDKLKARIKARRIKRLAATTLAYRMVLGAKVIGMYQAAASVGRGTAR